MTLRSLKVIENDTIRSGTHDFLLTLHSNVGLSRTVSEINSDFRRKSPIFPTHRVFNAPAEGVPLGVVYRRRCLEKPRMMGLSDGRKKLQILLAVFIQYRRVTDTYPATQPARQVAVANTLYASRDA